MIYGDSVSITYLCPLAGNANSNTPSLLIINSRGDVVVRTVKACDIAPVDCNIVVLLLLASSTDDVDDEEDGDHSIASWFKLDRSDAVPYATAPAPTMPTLNESDDVDVDDEVSS